MNQSQDTDYVNQWVACLSCPGTPQVGTWDPFKKNDNLLFLLCQLKAGKVTIPKMP